MRVSRRFAWLLPSAAFLAAVSFSTTCGSDGTMGPRGGPAELAFAVMAPAYISTLSLEVTGPGIDSALMFNVTVSNGVGTGSVRVPAGAGRRIVARAFDAAGVNTHRGDTTVTLAEGTNPSVTLTLTPLMGGLPFTLGFGSGAMALNRRDTTLAVGDTLRFAATAVRARGGAVPADSVVWASSNPAVATVAAGLVTGVTIGMADIVASYEGAAARRRVQVGPSVTPRLGLGVLLVSKGDTTYSCSDCSFYLIREDGSLIRNLRTNIYYADLSPDASRLVYASAPLWGSSLQISDTAGSAPTTVRIGSTPLYPRWSADGTKLTFAEQADGEWEIWTMNANGTGLFRVTYNAVRDYWPDWSPDGLRLAWYREYYGHAAIWTAFADGSSLTQFTSSDVSFGIPRYSPDGTRLAMTWGWTLFVVDANGTGIRSLHTAPGCTVWPYAWSPDSRRIAFSGCTVTGNRDVFVINADGTGLTNTTNTPTVNEYVWRWR